MTTYAMDRCAGADLDKAQARLETYFAAARERLSGLDNAAILVKVEASQAAWKTYLDRECGAVFENWKGGTIRGVIDRMPDRHDRPSHACDLAKLAAIYGFDAADPA